MRKEYALGFCFGKNMESVVLIRKNKPAWQAGLLNGIGGSVEIYETGAEAMAREFKEETGVQTSNGDWSPFCEMSGADFIVYCFRLCDLAAYNAAQTVTDEPVEKHIVAGLLKSHCVSNLAWLIEMAVDSNYGKAFYSTVRYSPPYRT
jgi:8-oxo-dGTP diphosphatase